MLLVEAKSIFKRLTSQCEAALNSAVGQTVSARQYEVTVEHVLLALLDDANSDIAFLVSNYDLEPARLRQLLQRSFEQLRSGNSGRPGLHPRLLEWMQDTWVVSSAEYDWTKIRSGALFARLVADPSKYSTSGIDSYLASIPKDDIR